MRESRTYGSVRGARGNSRPYREARCSLRREVTRLAQPTSNHVCCHVGFRRQSGLLVLRLRIVEFDPSRRFTATQHSVAFREADIRRPRLPNRIYEYTP
jgi:hypothetical protein